MPIRTYRDLQVYREADSAALEVSRVSKTFPRLEQVELARQLRRAARSVPANIVEGWGKRSSAAEFKRYLQTALGPCQETRMWLEMSLDEGYVTSEKYADLNERYERIGAMLVALWKKWKAF
ncbi:MAG: four helix bundle protein [Acidobacteria bacterium]|nr:four helix bundle protein [Acidobacteriota bacterium]MBI3664014.1 four helix bundle protein [Acidobacteriota bacterium]